MCMLLNLQHASGKKFQDVLEEAFIRLLNVEGELYIGIPPGIVVCVESRLAASVALDTDDLSKLDPKANPASTTFLLSSLTLSTVSNLLNTLDGRCAIVPAANRHLSARALARYYAALVDGSVVPPRHPSVNNENKEGTTDEVDYKSTIFANTTEKIHDAFLGSGDYNNLIFPNGMFGLGFCRLLTTAGFLHGFGHAGSGGSIAYCDINNRLPLL
ncbi:putative beta-lactamase/transpeptidase [Helianthus debilis subsp. tardiflorus]